MDKIEFYENEHIYIKNGVLLPSVTEIINTVYPQGFEQIPAYILNAKAQYGTELHEAIEKYEKGEEIGELSFNQEESLKDYLEIKEKEKIEVLKQEELISYKEKYCGKYDILGLIKGKKALIDIKTTYKLNKEYVEIQLKFYKKGLEEENEEYKGLELYVLWLPKNKKGKLVKLNEITDEEFEDLLKEYNGD